jgi:hypothetical protein
MTEKHKSQDPLTLLSDLSSKDVFYRIKSISSFRSRSSSGYIFKILFFVDESGMPELLKLRFESVHHCILGISLVIDSHLRNNPRDLLIVDAWKFELSEFQNNPPKGLSIYRND